MRKQVALILLMCMLLALHTIILAEATIQSLFSEPSVPALITLRINDPHMIVDGQTMPISDNESISPLIIEGSTYLPIRSIIEQLGGEVKWDAQNRTVEILRNTHKFAFVIDAKQYDHTDGTMKDTVALTAPAIIKEGRTLLPIRAVGEALDCEVIWDAERQEILIVNTYATNRLVVETVKDHIPDFNSLPYVEVNDSLFLVTARTSSDASILASKLNADPKVKTVMADTIMRLPANESYYQDISAELGAGSWGIEKMSLSLFRDVIAQENINTPIVVAVLDTGIDTNHPLFSGRLTQGFNTFDISTDVQDNNNHGTHVAGIVAQATPMNVKIMPIKVLNDKGVGSTSTIVSGIRHAIDSGAKIINLSLSEIKSSEEANLYDAIIGEAVSKGITVVIAAGNDSSNTKFYQPAHVGKDAIVVSSIDELNNQADRSNYGDSVYVTAPGVSIRSSIPNELYGSTSGTSMAAPHIAALTALLYCENPSISLGEIKNTIQSNSTVLGLSQLSQEFGVGMPNFARYLIDRYQYDAFKGIHPSFDQAYELNQEGLLLVEQGKYQEAVNKYTEAISLLDYDHPTLYSNRGRAYSLWGKHEQAIQDLDIAIKLEPNEGAHYGFRCISHLELGNFAEALADSGKALSLGGYREANEETGSELKDLEGDN